MMPFKQEASNGTNRWAKFRVLVVDDDPKLLEVIEGLFEQSGRYELLQASRAKDGLRIAEAEHPDAIVLDLRMPEMDGFEACRRLKGHEQTKDIPVIVMTAIQDPQASVKAFEAGASSYLVKPFTLEKLLDEIWSCIQLPAI